jgi:hypothetical protein
MAAAATLGVALTASFAGITGARAQSQASLQIQAFSDYDRGANISVLQRPHPEYDPLGVPVGEWLIYPKLDLGLGYTDNVLATNANQISDVYFLADPSVMLKSDWSRNFVQAAAGLQTQTYLRDESQNQLGWWVDTFGRLDLAGSSYVQAGGDARRGYDDRLDPNAPIGAARPVEFQSDLAYLRGVYELTRTRFILSTYVSHTSFDDVPLIGGGTLDETFNDNNSWNGTARGEYGVSPDVAAFLEGDFGETAFSAAQPPGEPNRNSTDSRILTGANFDIGALIRGEIGLGYTWRDYYRSATYGVLQGLAVSAKVEYFPTPLVTVTATLQRSLQDGVLINASGYFASVGTLRADYEFRRNIILDCAVSAEYDDYREYPRRDTLFGVSIGAKYLVSRGVALKAEASYADRASSGALAAPPYNDVRLMATVTFQI